MQIRVAGTAIAVDERRREKTSDLDLSYTVAPSASEQGTLLDESQGIIDRGVVGLLDLRRQLRLRERPQGRNGFHG